jgi:hypothetical protein
MSNQPLQDHHFDGMRHQLELLQYQVALESTRLEEASGTLDHNLAAASPTKNKTLFTKGAGETLKQRWLIWIVGVGAQIQNVLHKCKRRCRSNPKQRLSHQIPRPNLLFLLGL